MKKILFIATRNPYSGRYSGDVIRSLKIINSLKKKFILDVVCLDSNNAILEKKNFVSFKNPNYFIKILNCFLSLLKLRPIQFGLFISREMKLYIENIADNYDYLFFYHIRSSQYLPKNFYGKSILEMGDLYSDNYNQTFKNMNFYNPLKYIYLLESFLVKKEEIKIFSKFDRITLFAKKEANKIKKKFKNKIFQIDESVEYVRKKFLFSKKNNKILFIGNLDYLPNFIACRNFIKYIMPYLIKQLPEIKFSIIGNIGNINRFLLPKNSNVELLGVKKNLSKYLNNSFCGLANLDIATGVQGKVLTYMSYGLPVICSNKVAENFGSSVLNYNKQADLISGIISLKKNKTKSEKFSNRSIKFAKKLIWKKVSLKYLKLLSF